MSLLDRCNMFSMIKESISHGVGGIKDMKREKSQQGCWRWGIPNFICKLRE